jgi:hypothetical protein
MDASFETHDLRPHKVFSGEGPRGADIYRVRSSFTEWLVPNALRVFEWVSGPAAITAGMPCSMDDDYVRMYAGVSDLEQYMLKDEYKIIVQDRARGGVTSAGGHFTRCTSDDAWVRETHRRVTAWDAPLSDEEKTPGNLRWRSVIAKIEERARATAAAAADDALFVQS